MPSNGAVEHPTECDAIDRSLCLAKTLHVRRINDLEPYLCGALFAIIPWAGEKEVHSSPSVRSRLARSDVSSFNASLRRRRRIVWRTRWRCERLGRHQLDVAKKAMKTVARKKPADLAKDAARKKKAQSAKKGSE